LWLTNHVSCLLLQTILFLPIFCLPRWTLVLIFYFCSVKWKTFHFCFCFSGFNVQTLNLKWSLSYTCIYGYLFRVMNRVLICLYMMTMLMLDLCNDGIQHVMIFSGGWKSGWDDMVFCSGFHDALSSTCNSFPFVFYQGCMVGFVISFLWGFWSQFYSHDYFLDIFFSFTFFARYLYIGQILFTPSLWKNKMLILIYCWTSKSRHQDVPTYEWLKLFHCGDTLDVLLDVYN